MFGKKPQRIEVVRKDSTQLRLNEWRAHGEMLKIADTLWKDADFQLVMQVIANESPANFALLTAGIEDRALHQARTEGYNLALANLRAMRVPSEKTEVLESTYEPETTD